MSPRSIGPVLCSLVLWACSSSPPSTTPDESPPDTTADPANGPMPSGGTSRPSLSAEQCQARGGTVVGDIGDGATTRADYVCKGEGAPMGNVSPPDGGPIPIEGAVCCPK